MTPLTYDAVEARSRAIESAVAEVLPFCESWRDDLIGAGGAHLKTVRELSTMAGIKAAQFVQTGAAFADWQSGNSTAYKAVLYDLRRPQEDALRRVGRDPDAALRIGPEHEFGGRLLVSLPEQHKCVAMALIGCYHPTFIGEHFGFRGIGDSIPVAILLTLFGAHVAGWHHAESDASSQPSTSPDHLPDNDESRGHEPVR